MHQKRHYPVAVTILAFATAGCQQFYADSFTMSEGAADGRRVTPTKQEGQEESGSAMLVSGGRSGMEPAAALDPDAAAQMHRGGAAEELAPSPPGGPGAAPEKMFGQMATGRSGDQTSEGVQNLRQLTGAGEGADFDPAVTPAGSIIFASTRHRPTSDLYRKSPGGSAITQLTSDPANDVMPAVSPDGETIAFASDRDGSWDLYLISAEGSGQPTQLTSDGAHNIHPSFSPDGKRLVYSTYSDYTGHWQLAVHDLSTPDSRTLLGRGLFPTWAPEGDRILYQRARQRGTRWFSIWSMELEGEQASAPTELAASNEAALVTPAWGPDGEHVVFCTIGEAMADEKAGPPGAAIWLMRADGSERTRLTGERFANLQPTWADDGTIYFVSRRGDGPRDTLWSLKPRSALAMGSSPSSPEPASE